MGGEREPSGERELRGSSHHILTATAASENEASAMFVFWDRRTEGQKAAADVEARGSRTAGGRWEKL